jgi:hypothetical protein
MATTVIQIGNSDDKLTQAQWAHFFKRVDNAVRSRASQIHFSGTSHPAAAWQNAAWVFEIDETPSLCLYDEMRVFCEMFNQDSIAWTEGKTIFATRPTPRAADAASLSSAETLGDNSRRG